MFFRAKRTQSVLIMVRLSAGSAIQTGIQTLQFERNEEKDIWTDLFGGFYLVFFFLLLL